MISENGATNGEQQQQQPNNGQPNNGQPANPQEPNTSWCTIL
jgi:hypothetical protein